MTGHEFMIDFRESYQVQFVSWKLICFIYFFESWLSKNHETNNITISFSITSIIILLCETIQTEKHPVSCLTDSLFQVHQSENHGKKKKIV